MDWNLGAIIVKNGTKLREGLGPFLCYLGSKNRNRFKIHPSIHHYWEHFLMSNGRLINFRDLVINKLSEEKSVPSMHTTYFLFISISYICSCKKNQMYAFYVCVKIWKFSGDEDYNLRKIYIYIYIYICKNILVLTTSNYY